MDILVFGVIYIPIWLFYYLEDIRLFRRNYAFTFQFGYFTIMQDELLEVFVKLNLHSNLVILL